MTNKLSPEAQTCFEQVQKAPDNQKQSTFERACQLIKDKTQIATLALMLGLSAVGAPEAQAGEPIQISSIKLQDYSHTTEYREFYSQINKSEYEYLKEDRFQFYSNLYAEGSKVVTPENKPRLLRGLRMVMGIDNRGSSPGSYIGRMNQAIIPENSSFSVTLTQLGNYLEQQYITNKETIAQLDRNIAENQRIAEGLTQLTATLKKLEDK